MDVILNLKGELFSPEITFDWEFPDQSGVGNFTEFNTLIKRIEADPDELNRQIFSLLTFGSFSPALDYGQNLDINQEDYRGIVNSSVSNFLSNQLTNWISAYNKDFELGIDYQTGTSATNLEARDFIVSARQRMMQERLELAFVKNFTNNSAINPYTVDLVYKVKKDGSLKLKAYHKLSNDPSMGDVSNVSTTGVGFYFRKQFDKLRLNGRKDD